MKQRTLILAAAGVALSLALGALGPAAAQQSGDCLSPREIQEAVASGAIVTVDEAMSAAGVTERPIGPTDVCRRNGSLEYRMNTIDPSGEARRQVMDAQGG